MIFLSRDRPQLPKDKKKNRSLPIHIDGIPLLTSCAMQLIAVLQVYNSILLRLSRSCISVPPCTVAFALLSAVSFTLVFVKSSCVEIDQEFFQFLRKSYCSTQGRFKWSIVCLCVLSLYLVDLHLRLSSRCNNARI